MKGSAAPRDERKRQTSLLGFFEIDTVHLCDIRDSGEFCLTPTSPYRRLMSFPDFPGAAKAELRRWYQQYNPVLLRQEIHRVTGALMELSHRKDLMRQQSFAAATLEHS
ncbi:MAG: hypothetical protein LBK74_08080 [Treponema sp.]|nr:hypothetical protein [Treponema sp.]